MRREVQRSHAKRAKRAKVDAYDPGGVVHNAPRGSARRAGQREVEGVEHGERPRAQARRRQQAHGVHRCGPEEGESGAVGELREGDEGEAGRPARRQEGVGDEAGGEGALSDHHSVAVAAAAEDAVRVPEDGQLGEGGEEGAEAAEGSGGVEVALEADVEEGVGDRHCDTVEEGVEEERAARPMADEASELGEVPAGRGGEAGDGRGNLAAQARAAAFAVGAEVGATAARGLVSAEQVGRDAEEDQKQGGEVEGVRVPKNYVHPLPIDESTDYECSATPGKGTEHPLLTVSFFSAFG